RDYYEPRLLPRLLNCSRAEESTPGACTKEFKPVRPLGSLNRVQPKVTVSDVRWKDRGQGLAEVTVKVERNIDHGMPNGKIATDVYDLRVFRDGQLVGWAPASSVDWQLETPLS